VPVKNISDGALKKKQGSKKAVGPSTKAVSKPIKMVDNADAESPKKKSKKH
jgi:hypothetical protein